MKIMIVSNSPLGPTGYSVVTRNLSLRFKKLGHEISIFGYWGIDCHHPLIWEGMSILPRWRDPWGRDICHEHFKRVKADICMPIYDIWVSPEIGKKIDRTVGYVPTDHDPVAPPLLDALKECWKLIPFTNWAENSMKKAGLKQVMQYIPHGVDTNIFKPLNKSECRKKWGLSDDAFVIGIVAGNYDKEGRKRWDKQLEAIKFFKEQNPDCNLKIFLHTDVNNVVHGFDLRVMLKFFGLEKITFAPDPYMFITQLRHDKVAEIYNAMDVHMLISSREGFGIPIIESQACGIPCLTTDFASASELTLPELRVKVKEKIMTPLISWTAVPDSWHAAEILSSLYRSPDKLHLLGKKSLKNAKQYDWDSELIMGRWIKTLDKIEDALKKEPKKKKELKK